jgi:hypothetical protein
MSDEVYGPEDAVREEIRWDMDYDIIQGMLVAMNEDVSMLDKAVEESKMRKRIRAKMGCHKGNIAVWDEVEA